MSKRAERRWRTSRIVEQRKYFAEKIYDGKIPEDRVGRILGRCRRMHPYNCGRPKCGICQNEKLYQIPAVWEIRAALDFCEETSGILGHAAKNAFNTSAGLPRTRRLR